MKLKTFSLFFIGMLASATLLGGCDGLISFGNGPKAATEKEVIYEKELTSSTGKWFLLDGNKKATNTFFEFNGSLEAMTFKYTEEGEEKFSGKYQVAYRENTGENASTLTWMLLKDGSEKVDWVYCYADNFDTKDFAQFTTIKEERDEGKNDGRNYAHIYRISELPYKMGTYVLEGKEFKEEKDNYRYKSHYQIPDGKYSLDEDTYFTFLMPKPYSYALFHYQNGNESVEGVYWTADDKKTIYLFIEHDPYQYVRTEDRNSYDMTFSHDYPPDFYLRGSFDVSGQSQKIAINDLYHHDYSPTSIKDSTWKFGTYNKQ